MLHILLALAGEELHGYGIMQEIRRQSEGRVKLGPGTLYDNLQRLVRQRLVEEVDGPDAASSRRRYYRLSATGARRVVGRDRATGRRGERGAGAARTATEEGVMGRRLYSWLGRAQSLVDHLVAADKSLCEWRRSKA